MGKKTLICPQCKSLITARKAWYEAYCRDCKLPAKDFIWYCMASLLADLEDQRKFNLAMKSQIEDLRDRLLNAPVKIIYRNAPPSLDALEYSDNIDG